YESHWQCSVDPNGTTRESHSFPTRRSSDLTPQIDSQVLSVIQTDAAGNHSPALSLTAPDLTAPPAPVATVAADGASITGTGKARSEEHTSELQSRRDLVCRLLLEKKNRRNH